MRVFEGSHKHTYVIGYEKGTISHKSTFLVIKKAAGIIKLVIFFAVRQNSCVCYKTGHLFLLFYEYVAVVLVLHSQ